jgi:hypothetical protein
MVTPYASGARWTSAADEEQDLPPSRRALHYVGDPCDRLEDAQPAETAPVVERVPWHDLFHDRQRLGRNPRAHIRCGDRAQQTGAIRGQVLRRASARGYDRGEIVGPELVHHGGGAPFGPDGRLARWNGPVEQDDHQAPLVFGGLIRRDVVRHVPLPRWRSRPRSTVEVNLGECLDRPWLAILEDREVRSREASHRTPFVVQH